MKKITSAFFLLFCAYGFSQQYPLNFETPEQLMNGVGGATTSLVPDPVTPTNQVLQVVGNGELYDTAQLTLAANLDLSNDANNTITFRVRPVADYGTRTHLLKFEGVGSGGGAGATELPFTTTGAAWQNITLNFHSGLGNYSLMVLFPDFNNGSVGTFLFDDFAGGTNVSPPVIPTPSTAAPVPVAPNSQVYSIYNDTNSYTTVFPVAYSFGFLSAEPDLDPSATVNKAYRFNFGTAGWGQGEANANIASYGFLSFDYWAQPGLPNGFRFVMISNSGSVQERNYQIGTQEPLVTGEWKKVEIPLSYFTTLGFASSNFFQWKVSPFNDSVDNAGYVYVDNILLTVNSVLSNDSFTLANVKLYPNPATSSFAIEAQEVVENVTVYNMLGQEVLSKSPNTQQTTIDISTLKIGVYIVKTTINGVASSSRLVKE